MTKRFVTVGINDYSAIFPSGNANLSCCVADAGSIASLLVNSFGFDQSQSVSLTDQQASSDGIKAALRTLLGSSAPGDVACFFYSGHGSRTPGTPDQADCDEFYECIIPASGAVITDRDLFQIANTLDPSTVNFTVILDSCHSGGMDQETDDKFKCKTPPIDVGIGDRIEQYIRTLIPCGILLPLDSDACSDNVTAQSTAVDGRPAITEDPNKVLVAEAKTTLIAGCKFGELSYETAGHGLLTKAFLNIVNADDFQINYNDLLDQLATSVTNDFNSLILPGLPSTSPQSQTPQLRGQLNRVSDQFLGGFVSSK